MTKVKVETQDAPRETQQIFPFSFPTIANGITVMASSQEEANEKAKKIRESLEKTELLEKKAK